MDVGHNHRAFTPPGQDASPRPRALRALLVTNFPDELNQRKVEPTLARLGVVVDRSVGLNFNGDITQDVVVFLVDMGGHTRFDPFKRRARDADVPYVDLGRRSSGWPEMFRLAGVQLPGGEWAELVPDARGGRRRRRDGRAVARGASAQTWGAPAAGAEASAAVPAPHAAGGDEVPPAEALQSERVEDDDMKKTAIKSFGEALTASRKGVMSQQALADLLGFKKHGQGTVSRWEKRNAPILRVHYDKLLQLMPELAAAPMPDFLTPDALPRGRRRLASPQLAPADGSAELALADGSAELAPADLAPAELAPAAEPPPLKRRPAKRRRSRVKRAPSWSAAARSAAPPALPAPPPAPPPPPAPLLESLVLKAKALGRPLLLTVPPTDDELEIKIGTAAWTGLSVTETAARAREAIDAELGESVQRATLARDQLARALAA